MHDPAVGPGAGDIGEVDAEGGGATPDGRRSERARWSRSARRGWRRLDRLGWHRLGWRPASTGSGGALAGSTGGSALATASAVAVTSGAAPSMSIHISSDPTGTMSPASAPSLAIVPATGDDSSTVALSVITSASDWSSWIVVADVDVPLDDLGLGHALADVGQLHDVAAHSCRHHPLERGADAGRAGEVVPFLGVRIRRVPAGDPLDRRLERVEALLLHRRAISSAPKPLVRVASWTTTQRPVLRTDSSIVSVSSGSSVRRSMISASMPVSSAAASATYTIVP